MKALRILLVLVILVSLFFFLRATDLDQVLISMRHVGYKFFVLILVTFLAAFLATIGWKYCMGAPGKHLSLWELFLIRTVGEAVGLVNPTSVVGGDAVKVFLLREKAIEQRTVVASALISRTLMVLSQVFLLVLSACLLVYNGWFHFSLSRVPTVIYVVVLVAVPVIYLLVRNSWIKQVLRPTPFGDALARRTAKLRQQAAELRLELRQFYRNNKIDLVVASLLFAVHWILGGMEFYFILWFIGVPASVAQAILVDMGVVFFKVAGAFVPGQIGIEEYGNKVMLEMVGVVGAEVWIAASILRRARQLFWILFGLVVYLIMNKKWGQALRPS